MDSTAQAFTEEGVSVDSPQPVISMSVSLERKDHRLRLDLRWWTHCLATAHEHGWQPAGTEPCLELLQLWAEQDGAEDPQALAEVWAREWDGNYMSNDGQIITSDDAAALADALEAASDKGAIDCRGLIDFLRGGSCIIY